MIMFSYKLMIYSLRIESNLWYMKALIKFTKILLNNRAGGQFICRMVGASNLQSFLWAQIPRRPVCDLCHQQRSQYTPEAITMCAQLMENKQVL